MQYILTKELQEVLDILGVFSDSEYENINRRSGGNIHRSKIKLKVFPACIHMYLPFWTSLNDFHKIKHEIYRSDVTMHLRNGQSKSKMLVDGIIVLPKTKGSGLKSNMPNGVYTCRDLLAFYGAYDDPRNEGVTVRNSK